MKNIFKKPIEIEDTTKGKEPERAISAVAVIRSEDQYVFEFELFSLSDARIEEDGRVSFSMQKEMGPYGMTSICTYAYTMLLKKAFDNGSKKSAADMKEHNDDSDA